MKFTSVCIKERIIGRKLDKRDRYILDSVKSNACGHVPEPDGAVI